jgi:hypothetical protein
VKYEKEIRLCLGCTLIEEKEENDMEEGRIATPFDYSSKTILSIKDYSHRQRTEIDRVRQLDKGGGLWVIEQGPKDAIYENDPIQTLKWIGDSYKQRLEEDNIATVSNLNKLTTAQIGNLASKIRIPLVRLNEAYAQAMHSISGAKPPEMDYRKHQNPYEAKYGVLWEEKIKTARLMSAYTCITDLVEHIVVESEKVMKGTKHENDWVFYHDALSLMTAKETVEWMKKEGHYQRWILPKNGLHSDDKTLSAYLHQPVGNSPENMPWDTLLNQDVKKAVKHHVNLTHDLHEDDPKKFTISTPNRGSSAFCRVLENIPTSKRIIHDVRKVFESLEIVRNADGKKVQGVGNSNYGRRHIKVRPKLKKSNNPTGKRTRAKDDYGDGGWVHPHGKEAALVKMEESTVVACGGMKEKKDKMKRTRGK